MRTFKPGCNKHKKKNNKITFDVKTKLWYVFIKGRKYRYDSLNKAKSALDRVNNNFTTNGYYKPKKDLEGWNQ